MRLGDLTTLANVKAWMGTSNYVQGNDNANTSIDVLLQQLITRQSQAIMGYLERAWILPRDYINEVYDGGGGPGLTLRNWPVISVDALSIAGSIVRPQSVDNVTSPGFKIPAWNGIPPGRPATLELYGRRFWPGNQNTQVSYRAGYQITDEAQTIPVAESPKTVSSVTVLQPYGIWAQDVSVKYTNGTSLVQVTSAPAAVGQYRVKTPDQGSPLQPPGEYEFFQDDAGQAVLISYGFIPGALEQIAIELIVERFAYRQRTGEVSRTIAQQVTVRYDTSDIPAYAKNTLQDYKSILPI